MTSATPDFPSAITLPVPALFRRYFLWRNILVVLGGSLVGPFVVALQCLIEHPRIAPPTFLLYFYLFFLFASIVWEVWYRSQTRQFLINRKSMMATRCPSFGCLWRVHRLRWFTDAVVSVARSEWHGLPALQIMIEGKRRKTEWIVFREEDRATVETQIIPLIEAYRHRHRNEALADLLQLQ